jgi:NACHT conflict system protein
MTLPRRAVEHHLDRLTRVLSPLQLERLRALAALIGDDGRIPLDRALAVATLGGSAAQASFRKFREAVRDATAEAGVELELVVDSRKSAPDRTCWFAGADTTDAELAAMSAREAARLTHGTAVAPMVAEVFPTPPVVVYVSTAQGPAANAVREQEFVALLREALALRREPAYQVVDVGRPALGRVLDRERARLREGADVVVALVSLAYLIDSGGDAAWAVGAARRRPVLQALEQLLDGEAVVRSMPDGRVLGASPDAWRWLGWLVTVDGAVTRLPAETVGPLPPLHRGP